MAALASGNTTHAYLFSGPRGCGKTTSARILARCLNCAEYPTAIPCGKCDSCKELARSGSGSLDVVELDAASHGGVDDARELREQAGFAPVRDRYKIFIIDEAHMVTNQGFNALLKLVEEPPAHVKFIFATTEPEKVIGTIRSRTHHYPFRLVPPPILLEYLEQICQAEGIKAGKDVLSLVVRAGTGSVRDTLSVLDQIIGGSQGDTLDYERAVALLGYTSAYLIDDAVVAIGERNGAELFTVVDKIVHSGHDPRRFVEDLLQRFRDLIIIALAGEAAGDVFSSVPADTYAHMQEQAQKMGARRASRCADLTNEALNFMVGATAPRLQLELLCARLLVDEQKSRDTQEVKSLANGAVNAEAGQKQTPPPFTKPMEDPRRRAMPSMPPSMPSTPQMPNAMNKPGAVNTPSAVNKSSMPPVPPNSPQSAVNTASAGGGNPESTGANLEDNLGNKDDKTEQEQIAAQWEAIKEQAANTSAAAAEALAPAGGIAQVEGAVVSIVFPTAAQAQHFNKTIPALNALAMAIYQHTGWKKRLSGVEVPGVPAAPKMPAMPTTAAAKPIASEAPTNGVEQNMETAAIVETTETAETGDPAGVLGQLLESPKEKPAISVEESAATSAAAVAVASRAEIPSEKPFYAKDMPKLPPKRPAALNSAVVDNSGQAGLAEKSGLTEKSGIAEKVVPQQPNAEEIAEREEAEVSADDPVIDQSEVVGLKVVLKKFDGKIIGRQSAKDGA